MTGHGAHAFTVLKYYSPHNRERPVRAGTDYIILHTTEAPDSSSLRKLRDNGEAHYCVDSSGNVYALVENNRVAFHAGRSMWNGRTELDSCSIGIEVCGYHDRDITPAQYASLRELLARLKAAYRIPDERVLTHSMVAYATANRWHKRPHRGRKRCGMIFAMPSVRRRLGLAGRPLYDPDVRAGRLDVGDAYLARVLYGSGVEQQYAIADIRQAASGSVIGPGKSAWTIAGPKYNSAEVLYVFPNGDEYRGNQIRNWSAIPPGTRVVFAESQMENLEESARLAGFDGRSAADLAGDQWQLPSTIYIFPSGRVCRGSELSASEGARLPDGTRVLPGYVFGGRVAPGRSAFDAAGRRWNWPSTIYRLPDGRIVGGNQLSEKAIPAGSLIFFPE